VSQRLFLALWPPPEVVGELAAALPTHLSELRWQPAARWHITMAFLGDRSADKEARRLARLEPPAAEPVRLAGAGAFGPVLWVGVGAGDWLAELAHACGSSFDATDRRFRAHVTVARARSASGQRQLSAARSHLTSFRSSWWVPDELTLVSSQTGPQPRYEVIGRKLLTAT
jgi:RNA 2',3'-cyclic 3'-phosphodiesterase